MKTYLYFHIGCVGEWEAVFLQLLSMVHSSGLYEKLEKIKCGVLSKTPIPNLSLDKKIEIVRLHTDLSLYETITLHALHEHAEDEDFHVLYLHTKGVTRSNHPGVSDWVKLLAHFTIERHEECIEGLKEHDAVGVNLGGGNLHYSGNFWWSKASHLRSLKPLVYSCYNAPEYWIGSGPGKYLSLWQSHTNHYEQRYSESEYKGVPSKPETIIHCCNNPVE
jgi:hypothetical protein